MGCCAVRLLVRHINAIHRIQPGWALVGVLLVVAGLCLPAMHHLGDCHPTGSAGDPCSFCLLLNLTFLAVPTVLVLDLARRLVAILAADAEAASSGRATLLHAPRGPPFSY